MTVEKGDAKATESFADLFEQNGYVKLCGATDRDTMNLMTTYSLSYLRMGGYFQIEEKTASMGRYADAMGEALLQNLQPLIEKSVGFPLIPAYSYLRFYTAESTLTKHVDRPSCEISATLTVGNKLTTSWPIYVESHGQSIAVDLDVGDLMIYKGSDVPHWREKLPEGYWLQVFLHYVKSGGDFVDYGFDKRSTIGPWQGKADKFK
jgi:hypothetical protein